MEQRELEAETDFALRSAVERSSEIESLTRSVAWRMLLAFVSDQTQQRLNQIMLTPIKSMEDASEQNFLRGECAGLGLVKKFMEDQLKVSQETVALYRQALSEEGDRG